MKETVPNNKQTTNTNKYFYFLIVSIGVFLCSLSVRLIYAPSKISGTSMESTLHDGDTLAYSYLAMKIHGIQRGDILAINTKIQGKDNNIVKRVIGLPGESVQVYDDHVYINDQLIIEPYLDEDTYTSGHVDIVLGKDEYFVMGDNREESLDSRDDRVGIVTKDEIIGLVIRNNIN